MLQWHFRFRITGIPPYFTEVWELITEQMAKVEQRGVSLEGLELRLGVGVHAW